MVSMKKQVSSKRKSRGNDEKDGSQQAARVFTIQRSSRVGSGEKLLSGESAKVLMFEEELVVFSLLLLLAMRVR